MEEVKFRYNTKTLRYERVSISILTITLNTFGYITFGALFFVGLVVLQNHIIETPLEKSLRAENNALSGHKVILASTLQESNERMTVLDEQDRALYEQLFETKKIAPPHSKVDKEEILAAESDLFANWELATREQSSKLIEKAKLYNYTFSETAHINKSDLKLLQNLPTLPPVKDFEVDKLVSGFGRRINPFHKGLYHHDGIDISMPIGTEVVSPAAGTVIAANQSSLVAGFGNYIEIDHGNGIITKYAHLGDLKTRYGQKVSKGQTIALVGSSGGSIAPHLHYEVIKKSKNVNPVHYIIGGLSSTDYQWLVDNSKKENQSLD